MIRLLTGENSFAVRQAYMRLRDEYVTAHGVHSLEQRDGESLSPGDLPQLFQGASLFSSSRMVVIRDASANKSIWEVLPEYLEQVLDTEVVLIEPRPDKRTRTYKWLQKQADVKEFKVLSESDLIQWIQTQGRDAGINFEPEAARFLISYAGDDQWRLFHDINKLAVAGQPITKDLIRDIIDPHPQATAFELLDAAIGGRQSEVPVLVGIVKLTEDPYRFIGLLTSQVYALAVCFSAGQRTASMIAKDAGIHPYVAGKTQAIAKRITRARLSRIIASIATLDTAMKTGGGDPWLLVEATLSKIAAK